MTRVSKKRTSETVAWLQTNPSLDDLAEAFPDGSDVVQRDVDEIVGRASGKAGYGSA